MTFLKPQDRQRLTEIRTRISRATRNGKYEHAYDGTDVMEYDDSGGTIAECSDELVAELFGRARRDLEFLLELIDPSTRIKVPAKLRYQILRRSDFRCESCGATAQQAQLEVDHIRPVSQGGTNNSRNLRILCQPCNSGKGAGPA